MIDTMTTGGKSESRQGLARTLNLDEVAEALRLSRPTVRDLLSRGIIPGQKLGRQWRISERALAAFMDGAAWIK